MTARTLVMGVVNVTPDSFSDGGQWFEQDVAIAHGRHLLAQGADILDIGGESTRPGAERVSAEEELKRVVPVVTALAQSGATVSVDTMRAEVAAASLDAGALIINDVSGGLADPDMVPLVAARNVTYVVSHWRGHADVMAENATYTDVVGEVVGELRERLRVLTDAGADPGRLIVDPGLGFAKRGADNWRLLAHLDALSGLGHRVLIGASRKRFLGELLADAGAESLPVFRDRATAAVTALAAAHGVWAVRVHEVMGSIDAVRVAQALCSADNEPSSDGREGTP